MNVDDSKIEKPQLDPLRLSAVSGDAHFDIENDTLIGREVECTVTLPSPHISRYHAKLSISDGGIFLEDLNSANGTFVNGKRISEKTQISLGDELRFDDLAYRLTSRESGTSDATVVLSNKAVLDAVEKQQTQATPQLEVPQQEAPKSKAPKPTPSAPPEPEPSAEPEEDGTRILSSDQLKQAANVHQQSQSFTDAGSGPRFVATTAPIRGRVFHLAQPGAENTWTLGRSKECEICVAAPSVSRQHSVIKKEDGRFHIKALNESKPFMFNKLPQTSAMLKHNDHLQIGSIELIFRLDETSNTQSHAKQPEEEAYPTKSRVIALALFAVVAVALLLVVIFSQGKPKSEFSIPEKPATVEPASQASETPPSGISGAGEQGTPPTTDSSNE